MTANRDYLVSADIRTEPLSVRVALVDQARQLFGQEFAKGLWISLGLPTVGQAASRQRRSLLGDHVDRFIQERLDPDPLSEVRAEIAFAVYQEWAKASGTAILSAQSFGRVLKRAGIASRRSNNTIYCGVRIKPEWAKNPDPLFDFGPLGQQFRPDGQEADGEG